MNYLYIGCLQEMERHMEESHPDRGDTQRSVYLYQNLTVSNFLFLYLLYLMTWSMKLRTLWIISSNYILTKEST